MRQDNNQEAEGGIPEFQWDEEGEEEGRESEEVEDAKFYEVLGYDEPGSRRDEGGGTGEDYEAPHGFSPWLSFPGDYGADTGDEEEENGGDACEQSPIPAKNIDVPPVEILEVERSVVEHHEEDGEAAERIELGKTERWHG